MNTTSAGTPCATSTCQNCPWVPTGAAAVVVSTVTGPP
jgi:hypothetical protein